MTVDTAAMRGASLHCNCYQCGLLRSAADEIDRLRDRVSELQDTILLQRAGDDIASSFGRNSEASRIERDIMNRRGEDWSGADVEWRKAP